MLKIFVENWKERSRCENIIGNGFKLICDYYLTHYDLKKFDQEAWKDGGLLLEF